MRPCCDAYRKGEAAMCPECEAMLDSDLFADQQSDLQRERTEDEAALADMVAVELGGLTREVGRQ